MCFCVIVFVDRETKLMKNPTKFQLAITNLLLALLIIVAYSIYEVLQLMLRITSVL